MSIFLTLIGFFGFLFGIGFLVYSFFSKKKRSKKKISIGILATFVIMVIGIALAPPVTEQAETSITKSTTSSTVLDTSSESREKDKAEKALKKEQKAREETEKKLQEEQKTREEAEKKLQEINQKTSTAETLLVQAETNPTRDNYNSALSAIQSIPGGNPNLSARLANVDSTIKATEAAQIAEQQRQQEIAQEQARQVAAQAEQQRQAQEQANQAAQQQNTQQTILVTRTGAKYHVRKCGNGTYTPATLEEAQSRGLTPCEKCFN
ncbi:hypothetical protein A5844_000592 [Enterococcus sp. 10A9_DIV0425]|uniref:Uncharacterized protein n=1 Tax=Candidatus Enterococcus wittei TaxID=1987383 RepID=A0A2C9XQC8_9ENTE|nr:hypothetical protein [Enterococcus sp. 10A9_DIV0425]OTP12359.1 hypothetical protein A5844_000592 [Enterococcus sp. 10A9_DIV0425]